MNRFSLGLMAALDSLFAFRICTMVLVASLIMAGGLSTVAHGQTADLLTIGPGGKTIAGPAPVTLDSPGTPPIYLSPNDKEICATVQNVGNIPLILELRNINGASLVNLSVSGGSSIAGCAGAAVVSVTAGSGGVGQFIWRIDEPSNTSTNPPTPKKKERKKSH